MSVSIVLPSYKPGWYLERCLDSIEQQTLSKSRFKVYLALNGPRRDYETDVLRLLSRYTFEYEYIYVEAVGVSHARNALLDISTESYVAFVDDDDVLSPNYLEQLLLHATDEYIAVSNVLAFGSTVECSSINYIGRRFLTLREVEHSLFKSREFFSTPWAKLIHKEIIKTTRFNTRLKVGEDSLFMAELSRRVKGVRKTSPGACYYVCQRENSASRRRVARFGEVKRITYLIAVYAGMIFKGYNVAFILSRICASLMHFRRLL